MSTPPHEGQWPHLPGAAPRTDPLQPANPTVLAPAPMPSGPKVDGTDEEATTQDLTRRASELPPSQPGQTTVCPSCGGDVATYESFCEACGGELTPTTAPPPKTGGADTDTLETTRPTKLTEPQVAIKAPEPRECRECGGLVGPDHYCTQCGARAVSERDHFEESPAPWVGGVSDVGLRHAHNEDAMALAAYQAAGTRAIMVVCDGITTSHQSEIVSMAAAIKARDVLVGLDDDPDVETHLAKATTAANNTAVELTDASLPNPGSCTIAMAVIADGTIYHGSVGDARVYWIDDAEGRSLQLTVDDSMAQVRIEMGMSREEAENSIAAHAVTRWLGRDTSDVDPHSKAFAVPGSGWLVVCSDGLWNYASEAELLAGVVRAHANESPAPVELAARLVRWACEQGGRDNVTVALARFEKATR